MVKKAVLRVSVSQARHVRRKQLHQYLSASLLRRERTSSGAKRKPDAAHAHPAHPSHPSHASQAKKVKRLSESSVSIRDILAIYKVLNTTTRFKKTDPKTNKGRHWSLDVKKLKRLKKKNVLSRTKKTIKESPFREWKYNKRKFFQRKEIIKESSFKV